MAASGAAIHDFTPRRRFLKVVNGASAPPWASRRSLKDDGQYSAERARV
jgi:hypothetical protein